MIQKYKNSHHILIGGDFNEDISLKPTRRLRSLKHFVTENQLSAKNTGKTYVGPKGTEISTFDFIYSTARVFKGGSVLAKRSIGLLLMS